MTNQQALLERMCETPQIRYGVIGAAKGISAF
jgi:hypothetical protein